MQGVHAGDLNPRPDHQATNLWHELGYKNMRQRLQALSEVHTRQLESLLSARDSAAASQEHVPAALHTGRGHPDLQNSPGMPTSASDPEAQPSGSGPVLGTAADSAFHQPNSTDRPASAPSGLRGDFLNKNLLSQPDSLGTPTASGRPATNAVQAPAPSEPSLPPPSHAEQPAPPGQNSVRAGGLSRQGEQHTGQAAGPLQPDPSHGPRAAGGTEARGHRLNTQPAQPSADATADPAAVTGPSNPVAAGPSNEANAGPGLSSAFSMGDLRTILQSIEV